MDATSGARITEALRVLENLKIDELRTHWQPEFGPLPPIRSGDMLRRLIAEKLQEAAFGRDVELHARLKQLVAKSVRGEKPAQSKPVYKPGTQLIREWNGQVYRVEVSDAAFIWNGKSFASLSRIAREITGTRWNGPLFFGLRPTEEKPRKRGVSHGRETR